MMLRAEKRDFTIDYIHSGLFNIFKIFLCGETLYYKWILTRSHSIKDELTSTDFSICHFLRFFAFGCGNKEESEVVTGEAYDILNHNTTSKKTDM